MLEEALDKAVRAMAQSMDPDEPMVVVDWILISANAISDERMTTYSVVMSNSQMPEYRAVGLLEIAKGLIQKDCDA